MYTSYWNIKANPFLNIIDERLMFPGDQHEEAIARICFLIESGRLAGLLYGPHGVGKSTVLENVAHFAASQNLQSIRMDAIPHGSLYMTRHILSALKIDGPTSTLAESLMTFRTYVDSHPRSLARTILFLDEAHYLAEDDGLYLVHYLCNMRIPPHSGHPEQPLFTIIMAGKPSLEPLIQDYPSLRQRVQLVFNLGPLTREQTYAYIQHHMRAVGGDIWSFDEASLDAIFQHSGGIPRKINLLCDTSLMLGFAGKVNQVNAAIVHQAARDTGLSMPPSHAQIQAPGTAPRPPTAAPAPSGESYSTEM